MAAPTGATAKLLTMLCWVRVVAQIEVLQRLALTKSLCQSYSKSPETKIGPNCNFFVIGNCCELPNCGLRRKNAGNLPCEGPFFALRGQGRVRNRKKVAEMPRFLFSRWADCLNGWISRWADCLNGWISQWADHRNGANHADVRILGGSAGSNV